MDKLWITDFGALDDRQRSQALSALVAVLSDNERAAVACELQFAAKKFDIIGALPTELSLRIFSMLDTTILACAPTVTYLLPRNTADAALRDEAGGENARKII